MHVLKIKLSTEKCFLTIKTPDYTKKNFQVFILLKIFFFCMTSKIATKHRSRQESAQSSTVHVVHYLHRSLWKLTGKSRFSCFFLDSVLSKRMNMMWAQQMAALNSLENSLPVYKAQLWCLSPPFFSNQSTVQHSWEVLLSCLHPSYSEMETSLGLKLLQGWDGD